jgi:hypothetical protein
MLLSSVVFDSVVRDLPSGIGFPQAVDRDDEIMAHLGEAALEL